MFNSHVMPNNASPQRHTNCGHPCRCSSFMEAPVISLFQSPKSSEIKTVGKSSETRTTSKSCETRTVSIQCPSPKRKSGDQSKKENSNVVVPKAVVTGQHHNSSNQTIADVHVYQHSDVLSPSCDPNRDDVDASTDSPSLSDLQRSVNSKVVKRKQVRKHKSKAATKSQVRTAIDTHPSVSDAQAGTAESEKICQQPSTPLSTGVIVALSESTCSTKEQSQHVVSGSASHRVKEKSVKPTPSKRKRKLTDSSESDAKKVKIITEKTFPCG